MRRGLRFRQVGLIAIACLSGGAFGFDRVFAFGDSLSDTGNTFNLTFGFFGGPPYVNGRFSNGPVWLEGFASSFGASSTAHRFGGNNFAYGGAEANTASAFTQLIIPNVGTQITRWQDSGASFGANDLAVVWAGSNDFIGAGVTDPLRVANDVDVHLDRLYDLGARQFLVMNLPSLGYIPRFVGGSDEATMNARTTQFNAALAGHAADLRARGGATVYEFDVAGLFNAVRTNPGAYGFTNVTDAFLDAGGNVDEFMFFDDLHPTARVHQILGQQVAQAVPEPATMAGLGLLALVAARRRKSRS